jgi:hypothetical protein
MKRMLTTILHQDFFQFNNRIYQQKEGLPMGAPFSPILAGTYIQNIEHNIITNIFQKYKILGYHIHVDDMLLVNNKQVRDIYNTLKQFNEMNPKLQSIMEKEKYNVINFLDITIIRNPNNVQYGIYRKPTTTENIIHNPSCHPTEHKMLAISYFIHRMNTYPIRNKIWEENIIKHIMTNDQYPEQTSHIININQKKKE